MIDLKITNFEVKDNEFLGILIDMSLTMGVFVMAKACTEVERTVFFIANKERFLLQGFNQEKVDFITTQIETAVVQISNVLKELNDKPKD